MFNMRVSIAIGTAFVVGALCAQAMTLGPQDRFLRIERHSVEGLKAIVQRARFVGCPEGGDGVFIFQIDVENTAEKLIEALLDVEVACHPHIIGELACGNLKNRAEILALLQALPIVPTIAPDEFLIFVGRHLLMGLGVGFVDVHLLASALLANVSLWTADRRLRAAADKLGVAFTTR